MLCKSPDNRIYAELESLNAGLLRIVASGRDAGRNLGLPSAIATQLSRLRQDELAFIAGTPVLLAAFVPPERSGSPDQIADAGLCVDPYRAGCDTRTDPWSRTARLFAASLLTWLWKTDQSDHLMTALCLGPGEQLPVLSVTIIEQLAGRATERLRVRFAEHPRFWPDLLRAARSRDVELRTLSRLAVLPLVLAEECSH